MDRGAIQDQYEEAVGHCYGCGRNNAHELHIESYWEGEECVCTFEPESYHTGIPGYVYGGLLASVIDCHGTATAAGAVCQAEGHTVGAGPMPRFVTGALHIDFISPTPLDDPMEFRGRATAVKDRKVVVSVSVVSNGEERARGEVVAVRVPCNWLTGAAS